MKKETSFGSMETLLEVDGKKISEFMIFEKEGRGHSHDEWETCHVVSGQGIIVRGDEHVKVESGDICRIPPNTEHWMIPEPKLEILLVYSKS